MVFMIRNASGYGLDMLSVRETADHRAVTSVEVTSNAATACIPDRGFAMRQAEGQGDIAVNPLG